MFILRRKVTAVSIVQYLIWYFYLCAYGTGTISEILISIARKQCFDKLKLNAHLNSVAFIEPVFKYKIVLTSFILFRTGNITGTGIVSYVLTYSEISRPIPFRTVLGYRFLFGKQIQTDGRMWLSIRKIFYINPGPTHSQGRYTSFKPLILMVFP
jgi:hypothetical protein